MKLSINPINNLAEIRGLTVEQLQLFDEVDLSVIIENNVLYTELRHLGYVLGCLSCRMTIESD